MADEIQNLIMNVQGRDQVEALRTAIGQEEDALRKSIAAHGQHDAATKASAEVVRDLQRQLDATQKLVQTSTVNTRGYGQAAMAAGYAVQDFASANGGLAQQ